MESRGFRLLQSLEAASRFLWGSALKYKMELKQGAYESAELDRLPQQSVHPCFGFE